MTTMVCHSSVPSKGFPVFRFANRAEDIGYQPHVSCSNFLSKSKVHEWDVLLPVMKWKSPCRDVQLCSWPTTNLLKSRYLQRKGKDPTVLLPSQRHNLAKQTMCKSSLNDTSIDRTDFQEVEEDEVEDLAHRESEKKAQDNVKFPPTTVFRKPLRPSEDKAASLTRIARILASVGKLFLFLSIIALLRGMRSPQAAIAVESTQMAQQQQLVIQKVMAITFSMWPATKKVLLVIQQQGLLLALLLSLSAFFSMAETSITTLWPWKVRELAEKEEGDGVFTLLRQDVTRFLTTILIGTTVVNIGATALVTDAATEIFGEAGVTAATGVMTILLLLFTEIAPKSLAVHNATTVARLVVRPVAWLSYILYPVGRFCTALSVWLLKLLGLKSSGEPFVSEEELKLMLRGAELSGAIEEEEQDMIENVLEIKDTYVREVMTPLVNVVAIDAAASLLEFKSLWVRHQYSRVPVYERRVDNIVGIAYAMDMLDYIEQAGVLTRITVGRIAHRPAFFVPDSMSVWNLLREFRIRKVHMAIVLNEYGGTVGLVTLEDAVEEIVGEIFDESDSKEEILKKTGYIVHRGVGIFDVDANTSIEDLEEALEVAMPEDPYHYETVSGFVCDVFGYIPRTGDTKEMRFKRREMDEEDRRDLEDDQDQYKGKNAYTMRYNISILAGNARRVASVRFEKILDPVEDLAEVEDRERDRDWENEREREEREREREREREKEKLRAEEWQQEWEKQERLRRKRFLKKVEPNGNHDSSDCVEEEVCEANLSSDENESWSDRDDDSDRRPNGSASTVQRRSRTLVAENIDVDAIDDSLSDGQVWTRESQERLRRAERQRSRDAVKNGTVRVEGSGELTPRKDIDTTHEVEDGGEP